MAKSKKTTEDSTLPTTKSKRKPRKKKNPNKDIVMEEMNTTDSVGDTYITEQEIVVLPSEEVVAEETIATDDVSDTNTMEEDVRDLPCENIVTEETITTNDVSDTNTVEEDVIDLPCEVVVTEETITTNDVGETNTVEEDVIDLPCENVVTEEIITTNDVSDTNKMEDDVVPLPNEEVVAEDTTTVIEESTIIHEEITDSQETSTKHSFSKFLSAVKQRTQNVIEKVKPLYHEISSYINEHIWVQNLLKGFAFIILVASMMIATMFASYFGYMFYKYERIADYYELSVKRHRSWYLKPNEDYSLLTMNVGYGISTPEFTYYFDEGRMHNGSKKKGKYNFGISEEKVDENIMRLQEFVKEQNTDLYLFQDVDTASTRSYKIDIYERLAQTLARYSHVSAHYQHTSYLFTPFGHEQGLMNSDLVTFSRHKTSYGLRVSLPIKETLFGKLSASDQCFSATYMPVNKSQGKYLVLLNVNLDIDSTYRQKQLQKIYEFADEEYQDGNYVIIAGNLNSDTAETIGMFTNQQKTPKVIDAFTHDEIPEHFAFIHPSNETEVATYHNRDIPYEKGVSYESHTSGFIVSDNIHTQAIIVDTAYQYSNHNPVRLNFRLLL